MTQTSHDDEEQPVDDMVRYETVDRHIAKITLNRPHRKNAIKMPEMNEELGRKLHRAEDDDEIKVIILAGAGTDFCSGEDVKEMMTGEAPLADPGPFAASRFG